MTRNLFLTVCCLKDKSIFPMQKTEIKVFPAGLGGQGQLILFQTSFRASLILPDPAFAYVLSGTYGLHSSLVQLRFELCSAAIPP